MTAGTLAQLARGFGFETLADAVVSLQPPASPVGAPAEDMEGALQAMIRHGASAEVIAVLRRDWAASPLELGLTAWDILCTTLVSDELAAELARAARPLAPILPPPGRQGIAVDKISTQAMAEALATPPFAELADEELIEGVLDHSIGAYHELHRRGAAEVLRQDGTPLVRTRRFVEQLHRARLETLASFYLDYLSSAYQWAPALSDLCEALLDAGQPTRLPAAVTGDPDLAAYAAARASLIDGSYREFHRRVLLPDGSRWYQLRVEITARTAPRLRMAEAAVGIACTDMTLPYRVVDLIADDQPDWRFGAAVRCGMHARFPARAPLLVDEYLARFGSDVEFWRAQFDGDFTSAWHQRLLASAAAEVLAAPHSAASWWALAYFAQIDSQPTHDLIAGRLRAQCARVVA